MVSVVELALVLLEVEPGNEAFGQPQEVADVGLAVLAQRRHLVAVAQKTQVADGHVSEVAECLVEQWDVDAPAFAELEGDFGCLDASDEQIVEASELAQIVRGLLGVEDLHAVHVLVVADLGDPSALAKVAECFFVELVDAEAVLELKHDLCPLLWGDRFLAPVGEDERQGVHLFDAVEHHVMQSEAGEVVRGVLHRRSDEVGDIRMDLST